MDRYYDIINFWFEGINDQITIKSNLSPFNKWFSSKPDFDAEIKSEFLADYDKAKAGEYKEWEANPKSSLALILIFDQFSRNLFRDNPKAYETDMLALKLALQLIGKKGDHNFLLIERSFLYMPLMHAENIGHQQRSVERFTQLARDCMNVNPANANYYNNQVRYAQHHHGIIKRFGRFPHRNAILNRPSTPEEVEFLTDK